MQSNTLYSLGSNIFRYTMSWESDFHKLDLSTVNFDQQGSIVKLYRNYVQQYHSSSIDILEMIVDTLFSDQDSNLHVQKFSCDVKGFF